MKKQLQLILSTLFMALASLTGYGQVGSEFTFNNITYKVTPGSPNTVTAIDYNTTGGAVTIPQTVNHDGTDYDVTAIGDRAFWANQLTRVTIPGSVTTIGNAAFQTNQLTRVTIPGSVTSIGVYAFQGNPIVFASVLATTPPSLVGSPHDAFSNRWKITVLVPSGSVTDYENHADWTGFKSIAAFQEIDDDFTVDGITYQVIGIGPLEVEAHDYDGSMGTDVIIPQTVDNENNTTYTVTSIGVYAFWANQLTRVTIPGSVTTIENGAFQTNQLTRVTIGNSVTSIGNAAFQGNQLTRVTIPGSVTTIKNGAFQGNPIVFASVLATIPPSLVGSPHDAFSNRGKITVLVPSGSVTDYENHADWTDFASIKEGIEVLIDDAPAQRNDLTPFSVTITFKHDVTGFTQQDIADNLVNATVVDNSFSLITGSTSAYTVQLRPTVCEGTITIDIPEGVAEYASNFPNLAAITTTITVNALPMAPSVSNSLVQYCVGQPAEALTATGDNLLWYTSPTDDTGDATAPTPNTATAETTFHYVSQKNTNGCESKRAEIVVTVEACSAQTGDVFTVSGMNYEITSVNPNEVKVIDYIGSAAEVEIPEMVNHDGTDYDVTAIGDRAFEGNKLTEVTIPNDVTSIGPSAFVGNPDLDLVTVEATHPPSLHKYAFADRSQINLVVPVGMRQTYLDNGWDGFKSTLEEGQVLSTGSNDELNDLTLYPNPARDKVYIDPGSGQELKQVNIYTMTGAHLYSENGREINTSRLSEGMYLFEIVTKTGARSMKKVIIQ